MDQRNDTALDFAVSDHGSIIVLSPCTSAAREWVKEHLPDDAPRIGKEAVAIERRCFPVIYYAILEEGLVIA
jgi:hypothetical protein